MVNSVSPTFTVEPMANANGPTIPLTGARRAIDRAVPRPPWAILVKTFRLAWARFSRDSASVRSRLATMSAMVFSRSYSCLAACTSASRLLRSDCRLTCVAASIVCSTTASVWPLLTDCPTRTASEINRPTWGDCTTACPADEGITVPATVVVWACSPVVSRWVRMPNRNWVSFGMANVLDVVPPPPVAAPP